MKYDLSTLHLLVEDWADTKDLIHREREWRKQNNMTTKELNTTPRKFQYDGTQADYFKQQEKVTNPLGIQRSFQGHLKTVYGNQPKIIDKAKKEGITKIQDIPAMKQLGDKEYSQAGGLTDFRANTIGINTNTNIQGFKPKDLKSFERHEDEHGRQRAEAYKQGGYKAVDKLATHYGINTSKRPILSFNQYDSMKHYRGDPLEYTANLASNGTKISDKVRSRIVNRYLSDNHEKLANRFVNHYGLKGSLEGDYSVAKTLPGPTKYIVGGIKWLVNKGPNFLKPKAREAAKTVYAAT